ncbi:hypothetical protein [Polaribacter septentrionalilitoris]|uniref:hypothetical protein n=1 Tax=Polaribacter septentrionalilitoris TaxID=2494657 RepID=UPI0013573607|nr:hypothetical protein [Polaribacter septentrionalilitoris]
METIKEEKRRISNYLKKIMKLIANEVLNNKIVTKEDLYLLLEKHGVKEQILAKPKNIKYKFSKKHLPRVRVKCEFKSLKTNIIVGLRGGFSIRKHSSISKNSNLSPQNFYIEEYLID